MATRSAPPTLGPLKKKRNADAATAEAEERRLAAAEAKAAEEEKQRDAAKAAEEKSSEVRGRDEIEPFRPPADEEEKQRGSRRRPPETKRRATRSAARMQVMRRSIEPKTSAPSEEKRSTPLLRLRGAASRVTVGALLYTT